MEWSVNSYVSENSKYYKIIGYMDGYNGVEGFDIEVIDIPVEMYGSIKKCADNYNIKYKYYSKIKNPSKKILDRIDRNKSRFEKFTAIVAALEEFRESEDG